MSNIINTVNKNSIIVACKKRAKEILKNQNNTEELTLMQCLDIAAKEMKFSHWHELRTSVKNKLVLKTTQYLPSWESLIYKYFTQGYETIHFEVRNNIVEIKGRKLGIIESIRDEISKHIIEEVLNELEINPLNYDWLSKEMYNIQTMPVFDIKSMKESYDIVVLKKDTFELKGLIIDKVTGSGMNTTLKTLLNQKLKFNETLENLGFSKININEINFNFGNKNIFIAGAAGTGKTKTVKVLIEELKSRNLKVAEIAEFISEDDLDTMILAYMKLSPDYFYIPEMRSEKIATWLNKLIQTGHHVITTLHGANIDSIYARMKMLGFTEFDDIGLPMNNLLIYQEMHRILCPHCKEKEFSFKKIMKDQGLLSYINKYDKHEEAQNNIYKVGNYNECTNKDCFNGWVKRTLNAETFNTYQESETEKYQKYIRYHTMNEEERLLTSSIERMRRMKIGEYLKTTSLDCHSNHYARVLNGETEI